ncbi:MAG: histidinol-phosphate transaminase [Veillonellaceae bacterium]|nr:histidinol-phosphate transaminase [Veillonellaceae bacterium]
MLNKEARPRPIVTAINPYEPGWADRTPMELCHLLNRDSVSKLSFNESPYGPSPKAVAAMQAAAGEVHRYHDMEAKELRQKIANHHSVAVDCVYIGSGGDETISLLVNAYVSPGDEVVIPWPTFGQYLNAATIMDGITVKVPVRQDDLKADLDGMLAALTPRTKIIFLCNPNNPTGVPVNGPDLRTFLRAVPENILVGLDEAYAEFVTDPSFVSGIQCMAEFSNVVVIRTFSKIYGLAGMRVGYGIARPEIVNMIQRVRPLFNVNNLAQFGAMAALDDHEHLDRVKADNTQERIWLGAQLAALGIRVVPSQTNFLFVDTGLESQPLVDAARNAGFIIKSGAGWGFPTFLRISLGTHEQNEGLLAVLGQERRKSADQST